MSELVEMYMHLLAAALLFTAHALAGHFIGQMDGKPKYVSIFFLVYVSILCKELPVSVNCASQAIELK